MKATIFIDRHFRSVVGMINRDKATIHMASKSIPNELVDATVIVAEEDTKEELVDFCQHVQRVFDMDITAWFEDVDGDNAVFEVYTKLDENLSHKLWQEACQKNKDFMPIYIYGVAAKIQGIVAGDGVDVRTGIAMTTLKFNEFYFGSAANFIRVKKYIFKTKKQN